MTETEAVNLMLLGIGVAPIVAVDGATRPDIVQAVLVLRDTVREVQSRGWRFNTEYGYEVAPFAEFEWEYRGATLSEIINIFKPPANLLSFEIHRAPFQQGTNYMDCEIRDSKTYREASLPVPVFYDRALNRDGWTRDYIYIDPMWRVDFTSMPEEARRYCVILACRRFGTAFVGQATPIFDKEDEFKAERELKRKQGAVEDYNIFQNYTVIDAMGGRPFGPSGSLDNRYSLGQG